MARHSKGKGDPDPRVSHHRLRLVRGAALACAWLCAAPQAALGAENGNGAPIAPFRVLDTGGLAVVRYRLDDAQRDSPSSEGSFQTMDSLEEELQLWASGYAYHPNLLSWQLSGGPVLVQQTYDSNSGSNRGNDLLWNFATRLDFLQQKPYPVSFYARRAHPTLSTSLAGSFLSETTEYGLSANLRQPLSPVLVELDARHAETRGEGFDTRIDDVLDLGSIRLSKSYRGADWVRLGYTRTEQDSASGSPNLPVVQTLTRTDSTEFSAENIFGQRDQITLRQQGNFLDQAVEDGITTDYRYAFYTADLRVRHSPELGTYYRYNYNESSRESEGPRFQEAVVGFNGNNGPGFGFGADAHFSSERASGFQREIGGAAASVSYSTGELRFGSVSLGMSLNIDRTDQKATSDFVSVFGERITLTGTAPSPLRNPFVVAGTVTIRNQTQTQVFVEGQDYRLVIVGSTTSVQRLLGGNILDGETVLVDYDYQAGGTVRYGLVGQTYSASTTLLKHIVVFANYRDLRHSIIEGSPTQPLNDLDAFEAGLSANYPLGRGWAVGGEVRFTDHNEDIAPYQRDYYSAYVDLPLPGTLGFRLSAYREKVDNANSPEDVDLVRYTAHAQIRAWQGAFCSLDADYEQDTGGTLERKRYSQSLGLDWRVRRVRLGVYAHHYDETQGTTQRDNTMLRATISREF